MPNGHRKGDVSFELQPSRVEASASKRRGPEKVVIWSDLHGDMQLLKQGQKVAKLPEHFEC